MSDAKISALRHPAGNRELKEDFARADRDRDGRIDAEEFARLMGGLEADMSGTDLRMAFARSIRTQTA